MEDQEAMQNSEISCKVKASCQIPVVTDFSLRNPSDNLTLPPNKATSKPGGDFVKKQILIE